MSLDILRRGDLSASFLDASKPAVYVCAPASAAAVVLVVSSPSSDNNEAPLAPLGTTGSRDGEDRRRLRWWSVALPLASIEPQTSGSPATVELTLRFLSAAAVTATADDTLPPLSTTLIFP